MMVTPLHRALWLALAFAAIASACSAPRYETRAAIWPPATERAPQALPTPSTTAVDPAEGQTLTIDDVALLAVTTNPELRRARGDALLADLALREAAVLPPPDLHAGAALPVAGAAPGDGVAWNAGVDWEITSARGRADRVDAAGLRTDATHLDIAWQEWSVLRDARRAAMRVAAWSELTAMSEHALDEQVARARQVELDASMGRLDHVALVEAHAATQAATARLDDARAELAAARAELAGLLGEDVAVPATIVPSATPPDAPGGVEPWLDGLDERRLDLRALATLSDAAARDAVVARLTQFPPMTLGVGVDRDNAGLLATTLDLTVTPSVGRTARLAIERADIGVILAEQTVASHAASVRAEVISTWSAADAAAHRLQVVDAAERQARAELAWAEDALVHGWATRAMRDEAARLVWDATVETARARADLSLARIDLEAAAGVWGDVDQENER